MAPVTLLAGKASIWVVFASNCSTGSVILQAQKLICTYFLIEAKKRFMLVMLDT
jgi:hypothetical protein